MAWSRPIRAIFKRSQIPLMYQYWDLWSSGSVSNCIVTFTSDFSLQIKKNPFVFKVWRNLRIVLLKECIWPLDGASGNWQEFKEDASSKNWKFWSFNKLNTIFYLCAYVINANFGIFFEMSSPSPLAPLAAVSTTNASKLF